MRWYWPNPLCTLFYFDCTPTPLQKPGHTRYMIESFGLRELHPFKDLRILLAQKYSTIPLRILGLNSHSQEFKWWRSGLFELKRTLFAWDCWFLRCQRNFVRFGDFTAVLLWDLSWKCFVSTRPHDQWMQTCQAFNFVFLPFCFFLFFTF